MALTRLVSPVIIVGYTECCEITSVGRFLLGVGSDVADQCCDKHSLIDLKGLNMNVQCNDVKYDDG